MVKRGGGSDDTERIVAAGFLLLKPVSRPEWLSKDLLPEQIVSGSACICAQFPGSYPAPDDAGPESQRVLLAKRSNFADDNSRARQPALFLA